MRTHHPRNRCVASGASIVLSRLAIGDLGTQYFADRGIFCAGRVSGPCPVGCHAQHAWSSYVVFMCDRYSERERGRLHPLPKPAAGAQPSCVWPVPIAVLLMLPTCQQAPAVLLSQRVPAVLMLPTRPAQAAFSGLPLPPPTPSLCSHALLPPCSSHGPLPSASVPSSLLLLPYLPPSAPMPHAPRLPHLPLLPSGRGTRPRPSGQGHWRAHADDGEQPRH